MNYFFYVVNILGKKLAEIQIKYSIFNLIWLDSKCELILRRRF